MPFSLPLVRRLAGCLPLLAALLQAAPAHADEGVGVGLGPLLAFSVSDDDAPLLGWELSFSREFPAGRAALGGCYPLSSKSSAPGYHYVAWEPWLILGATLGAALGNDLQPRAVYGFWGGIATSASGSRFDGLWSDEGLQWVISLSGGWRGVGRNQQLYFTPKLWRMHGFRIHS